jgi:hypothetical protein
MPNKLVGSIAAVLTVVVCILAYVFRPVDQELKIPAPEATITQNEPSPPDIPLAEEQLPSDRPAVTKTEADSLITLLKNRKVGDGATVAEVLDYAEKTSLGRFKVLRYEMMDSLTENYVSVSYSTQKVPTPENERMISWLIDKDKRSITPDEDPGANIVELGKKPFYQYLTQFFQEEDGLKTAPDWSFLQSFPVDGAAKDIASTLPAQVKINRIILDYVPNSGEQETEAGLHVEVWSAPSAKHGKNASGAKESYYHWVRPPGKETFLLSRADKKQIR